MSDEQKRICKEYGSSYVPPLLNAVVGLSKLNKSRDAALNGLRHPPDGRSSGWFIWSGDYSEDQNFFEPVHVAHLDEVLPEVVEFLALAPGWRFLVGGDHIDVWFDKALLDI